MDSKIKEEINYLIIAEMVGRRPSTMKCLAVNSIKH